MRPTPTDSRTAPPQAERHVPLATADLARRRPDDDGPDEPSAAAPDPRQHAPARQPLHADADELAPLFAGDAAEHLRARWSTTQAGFVDDPQRSVRQADELVAEVMRNLADNFAHERGRLEAQMRDGGQPSTEDLRVALRRYRSFFERLLAL